MNRYPPPELTEECGGPNRGDTLLQLDAPTKRWACGEVDQGGAVFLQAVPVLSLTQTFQETPGFDNSDDV